MDAMILNEKFESVLVLDAFESLIWTDRYNEYGDFEIYMPIDMVKFEYFNKDYYVYIKESEHLMIIEDLRIESDADEGDRLTVTGRSLESILDRRIIWGQQTFSGNFQDAIKTMLTDNIISPSISDRKIENFIFQESTDTAITELTIDTQYTGDDLYSVISTLCIERNIGFKIVLDDSNNFVFSLYSGTDRSYSQLENPYVIFSPHYENIINSNYYTSKASYKNVALVGGEGEGSNRRTVTVGSASGLSRRETFTDARDVSSDTDSGTLSITEYDNQLTARGETDLSEKTESVAFEGEVEATQLFKYKEDFFIGDIVQISDGYGNEGIAYISELIITQNTSEISIYPTFQAVP